MDRTDQIAAFTMILLRWRDRYLMLQRGDHKHFAPGRWTGIGGRIEHHEYSNITESALREIEEETGIPAARIQRLSLRRALLQQRPGFPLTLLCYFTADVESPAITDSPEGSLHWVTSDELSRLDVIENTQLVIPLLIRDMGESPGGSGQVITGAARFTETGILSSIVWAE
jgi:8-oxo-dGTP diphosphatase